MWERLSGSSEESWFTLSEPWSGKTAARAVLSTAVKSCGRNAVESFSHSVRLFSLYANVMDDKVLIFIFLSVPLPPSPISSSWAVLHLLVQGSEPT